MASIRKELHLDAPAEHVWAQIRDFAQVHTRVVPGFVTAVEMDGPEIRTVTFANGSVARELLVANDDDLRRQVYAIRSDRLVAHSASVQVLDDGGGRSLLIWTTDVLPHDLAPYISGQMDEGLKAMKPALERQPARAWA